MRRLATMSLLRESALVLVPVLILIAHGDLALGFEAGGREVTVERIIELGTGDNRVMKHLDHLTNQIGPRPSASKNLKKACEWAGTQLTAFGLKDVRLEKCVEFPVKRLLIKRVVPLHNVVADIPGTDLPDEYVIVSAHIDSPVDGGTGASDNGTGVAAAMEAARLLLESGARPRRTIRFILFAAEEQGKLGSLAYVADHPELIPKISAMLNMDEGSDHISGIRATDVMMEDLEDVLARIRTLNPELPFTIQRLESLDQMRVLCCGTGGSSDYGPFLEAGVPALQWIQSGKTPVPFLGHTERDIYENVNPVHQKHSAVVIALAALGIADLDHKISRKGIVTEAQPAPEKKSRCCPASGS